MVNAEWSSGSDHVMIARVYRCTCVLYDQSSTAVRGGVKDRIPRLVVTYYPRKNIHTESRVSCNARGRGI